MKPICYGQWLANVFFIDIFKSKLGWATGTFALLISPLLSSSPALSFSPLLLSSPLLSSPPALRSSLVSSSSPPVSSSRVLSSPLLSSPLLSCVGWDQSLSLWPCARLALEFHG